jgi:DNA polymerase III epsilon subunit-like protein
MSQSNDVFIVFDTETTGFGCKTCRLVQIAWQVYAGDGQLLESHAHVVKPVGFMIPLKATEVHGFTTERARAEGKPLFEVLSKLCDTVLEYPGATIVAHNMSFDHGVVAAEAERAKLSAFRKVWLALPTFCTLKECKTPGPKGWNTLASMYKRCTDSEMKNAHTADADTTACAAIFFHHRKRQAEAKERKQERKRKREEAEDADLCDGKVARTETKEAEA